jgi:hypothetical protein
MVQSRGREEASDGTHDRTALGLRSRWFAADRAGKQGWSAAARRLPVLVTTADPAPDTISATSLSAVERHLRLPDIEDDSPKRQRFKRHPIGFLQIDFVEVQAASGKLYLFVAIDRTSKFAVTQLVDKADRQTAWEFLEYLLEAVPYRLHTIFGHRPQWIDPEDRSGGRHPVR